VITDRGSVPHPPARFALGTQPPVAVTSWAGPWPVDERWWHADSARQVVRCQLVDVSGRAYLVTCSLPEARWHVEAIYD
jgi:protein ImuB